MSLNVGELRRVPWTCQWGYFGDTAEIRAFCGARQAQNGRDRSPWICLHPHVLPKGEFLYKGDCENCPSGQFLSRASSLLD
jgi:hypothetical protein